MKDIMTLLSEAGITIPEDKKADFNQAFHSNYKTVKEFEKLNNKITSLNGDYAELKGKYEADLETRNNDLTALQEKLNSMAVESKEFENLKSDFSNLKSTYETEKENYAKALAQKSYEFGIKEKLNGVQFSSNSAKKAVLGELLSNPLPVKDGEILGFDDYLTKYKEQDADAFITDKPTSEPKAPMFSSKNSGVTETESAPVDNTPNTSIIW